MEDNNICYNYNQINKENCVLLLTNDTPTLRKYDLGYTRTNEWGICLKDTDDAPLAYSIKL